MATSRPGRHFECPKCGSKRFDLGEIHAPGSWIGKLLDVQGRRFTTVTCRKCGFTEFFKGKKSTVSTFFDLFSG